MIRVLDVAQLTEELLSTPEVCSSYPDNGKIYIHLNSIEETKVKKRDVLGGSPDLVVIGDDLC